MKYTQEKWLKLLGLNIRKARISGGVTQSQLAFECGIIRELIGKIERGQINTTLNVIFSISEVLEINPKILFEFSEYTQEF